MIKLPWLFKPKEGMYSPICLKNRKKGCKGSFSSSLKLAVEALGGMRDCWAILELGLKAADTIQTIGKSAKVSINTVTAICPTRRQRRWLLSVRRLGCQTLAGRLPPSKLGNPPLVSEESFKLPCSDIFRNLFPHAHKAILEHGDGCHNDKDHDSDGIGIPIIGAAAGLKGQPVGIGNKNIGVSGRGGCVGDGRSPFVIGIDHGEVVEIKGERGDEQRADRNQQKR